MRYSYAILALFLVSCEAEVRGVGNNTPVDWTRPGTIGSAIPNTGAFTALNANSISTLGSIGIGTTANSSSALASIGTPILNVPGGGNTTATVLQVSDSFSDTSGLDQTAVFVNEPSVTSDSSATYVATYGETATPSNSLNYSTLYGGFGEADFNSTAVAEATVGSAGLTQNNTSGSVNQSYGLFGQNVNRSNGALNVAYGVAGEIDNVSSGTITQAFAVAGAAKNLSTGTITSAGGTAGVVENLSTGSVPQAFGAYGEVVNSSTGTITLAAALDARVVNSGGGVVTTAYGVYIPQVQGTTSYGIYESDSSPNFFTGSIGVGTVPGQAIDVVGNIRTSGCLYYASSSLGTCVSDERLKKNVKNYDLGLNELLGIRPVTFQYRGLAGLADDGKSQIGVIAQDVEKVAPSLVVKEQVKLHPEDKEKTEVKAVDYSAFTYMLINSVKSVWAKVSSDDSRISNLEKENQALKAQLTEMNDRLSRLAPTTGRAPASESASKHKE